jgi:hypothetical protein
MWTLHPKCAMLLFAAKKRGGGLLPAQTKEAKRKQPTSSSWTPSCIDPTCTVALGNLRKATRADCPLPNATELARLS